MDLVHVLPGQAALTREPVGQYGYFGGGVVGDEGGQAGVVGPVEGVSPGDCGRFGGYADPAAVVRVGAAGDVARAFEAVEDPGDGARGDVGALGQVAAWVSRFSPASRT